MRRARRCARASLERLAALLLAWLVVLAPPVSAGAPVAGGSLYGMKIDFVDQAGVQGGLDRYRGSPVIVSLFQASCTSACPLLIAGIRQLELRQDPARRARLRVLLVTLDPDHDTPEELARVAAAHGLDLTRWTLARADAASLRRLASALGIRYERRPDGQFDHAPIITLLDAEGRPVEHTEHVLERDPDFESDLARALAAR